MRHDLPFPIIQSKLHRPPLPPGAVHRERLSLLAPRFEQSVCTLICAPAGYGKSTLAAEWAVSSETPSAWLSLDEADNDIRVFSAYVVAAIRNVFPNACESVASLLNSRELPPPEQIAGALCVDFELIEAPLILVLDDYHRISESQIHDFLNALLRRPPHGLRIVIVSRRDPPLALQSMRANGTLLEVRSQLLAFDERETQAFLDSAYHGHFSATAARLLHERTEGWPVGIRLALLAAPERESAEELVDRIPSDVYSVRDYLMHEVLNKCDASERALLLSTSLLERFCESVLPDLLVENHASDAPAIAACARFMRRIRDAGLFSVPLDSRQEWYRYHHLFKSMLMEQAMLELGRQTIVEIHVRASAWFERNAYLEEAIQLLLSADRPEDAAALIVRNRNPITNAEQWIRLASWLRALPDSLVDSSPALLLLQARLLRTGGAREESQKVLASAEQLLSVSDVDSSLKRELQGSFEAARCYQLYAHSDGQGALQSAQRALELLPMENQSERGFAMIIFGGAMQMIGDASGAREALYAAMPDASSEAPTLASRVLAALGFVEWMDADLSALAPVAGRIIEIAGEHNLREVYTAAQSFYASVEYHRNELDAVTARLGPVIATDSIANAEFHTQNMIICALAHQELGRPKAASELAAHLQELVLRSGNAYLIGLSRAFGAELARRQGRLAEAEQWALRQDANTLTPMYTFLSPNIVLARILVLADTDETRERARPYIDELVDYLVATHNRHFLAEALALRALLAEREEDIAAARKDLESAISITQPSRHIRIFADLGPRIRRLLSGLSLDEDALVYVGEIMAAIGTKKSAAPSAVAVSSAAAPLDLELLSKRELQILSFLAQRLSNKEIARELNISDITVKRHSANIYQKLGVHGRRQAVAKAIGLGVLSSAT